MSTHTVIQAHGVSSDAVKKKLIRRTDRELSQQLRRGFQFTFAALNIFLGIQFYQWVRYYESGGATRYFERPPGVEGWLPIAALMNLKYWMLTGLVPKVHPAAMFLLIAFLLMSVLMKKAFCSWLCPIGTLSEYLWKAGKRVLGRTLTLPRWLDIPLRGLKYLLLSFFVFVIGKMSAEMLADFLMQPYGIIADVKMLNFFRHIGGTALAVLVILVVGSVLVQNLWCRYLCPYGALMGLVSLISPAKIRREAEPCIDCGKCAKACPQSLPVDKLVVIRSAECTNCLECVAICPASGALHLALPGRRRVEPWAVAAVIAVLFFGIVGYAKLSGHWKTNIAREVYMELVPSADHESHPGM
jgi:polyferredoxin